MRFIPHGWNTAVGLAADLQLASAFPGTDLVEYLTGSPFIDEITVGGWQLDADGMLAIPASPGSGWNSIGTRWRSIPEFEICGHEAGTTRTGASGSTVRTECNGEAGLSCLSADA